MVTALIEIDVEVDNIEEVNDIGHDLKEILNDNGITNNINVIIVED